MKKAPLAGGGARGGTGWPTGGYLVVKIVANSSREEGAAVGLERERRGEEHVCVDLLLG